MLESQARDSIELARSGVNVHKFDGYAWDSVHFSGNVLMDSNDVYDIPITRFKSRNPGLRFRTTKGFLERLRMVKSRSQVQLIKCAVSITKGMLEELERHIKPGLTEIDISRIASELAYRKGAEGMLAFDPIVASGPNTAYPHHVPCPRRIRKDEPVLVDFGVRVQGWCSDLTRMYFLGSIDNTSRASGLRKVYRTVLEMLDAGLKEVKPGIPCSKVFLAAQDKASERGMGKSVLHSFGHGIGLDVHEAPSLGPKSKGIFEPGMVFAVEPGLYVSGIGGARIEKMLLVTQKGYSFL
jgi:Xaa-Pro aminopeptidase